ncbi:MAG: hypothetical protein MUF87_16045 [Anaerolineae bacterium]|jgi:hypothetical protein|nr:hypothetical protein [Anaerolineae bacterium]
MPVKALVLALIIGFLIVTQSPNHSQAQDQINYISNPDEITVFLNNVVFVRDQLRVPTDVETQIVLPAQTVQDTLVLRNAEGRLPRYTISRRNEQLILTISGDQANSSESINEITLEYIAIGGMTWKPLYNLNFSAQTEDEGPVGFDFFAEIRNDSFTLSDAQVTLVAGQVDVAAQIAASSPFSANQRADLLATATAFSSPVPTPVPGASSGSGSDAISTQYLYTLDTLTSSPGDLLYVELLETQLPARRVLTWNAGNEPLVRVIYKVTNNATMALTEGIVRSYQDGLFTGSDPIENTPIGGEGSVTVGFLRDIRVRKEVSQITIPARSSLNDPNNTVDYQYDVSLIMLNFTSEEQVIEVTDVYPTWAQSLSFSVEPEREGGNLLRWLVTLPVGEEVRITYQYISD